MTGAGPTETRPAETAPAAAGQPPPVAPAPKAPALCRRRLRTELRLLREGAGMTGRQVASAMGWSVAKVSRLERAEGTLRDAEIRAVCGLYRVPAEHAQVLSECAARTRARQWWQTREYRRVLPPGADGHLGLEAAASEIVLYDPESVPELLRTAEYSAAVAALPGWTGWPPVDPSAARVRMLVVAGKRRRAVLDRPEGPPRLRVVLTEAALHRTVGDREVQRAQLHRLAEVSRRPGVELRILPFGKAAAPGLGGAFAVFGFADGSAPMVVREQLTGVELVDDQPSVGRYCAAAGTLLARAAGPAASLALIGTAAGSRFGNGFHS
ncbi:helix-turn-helix domain-containing protein [Streptacidiphilus carbonis]|uniref:helix-turn-helix domain-containing protein n=1 Tax=Streptacidiphilus carbonis TaxID=105422 RepID=UPI0005A82F2A|nr:helix-turn-helix transcriptional regulator [Streptacidiphilus carbonis]